MNLNETLRKLNLPKIIILLSLAWQNFFMCYPALLYGIAFMLGISWCYFPSYILLLPTTLLILPLLNNPEGRIRFVLSLSILFSSFLWTTFIHDASLPLDRITGTAQLSFSSVSLVSKPFGSIWSYKGNIKNFQGTSDIKLSNIPFRMAVKDSRNLSRPLADCSYIVKGQIKEFAKGSFQFIPEKNCDWNPIPYTWSFAEKRNAIKQSVKKYIQKNITDKVSATFLTGLSIGEFDDRKMQFEFGRFGLQHIMAISGFHFAILAAILSQFLTVLFSKRTATHILLFLMSTYFVFLGSSPSIMRSWIMISIGLFSFVLEKRSFGLNSLGVALIVVLFVDPLAIKNLGFLFSFATTAGILLFFGPFDIMLQRLFKKRELSEVIEMSHSDQWGYLGVSFLRQALALALAVNCVALPMTLFFFHKFPLLGIVYNLFFPFLVSISMLMLIVGGGLLFIPPVSQLIHYLNSCYTKFILNFAYELPINWDRYVRTDKISFEIIVFYLTITFSIGVLVKYILKKRAESHEFQYI